MQAFGGGGAEAEVVEGQEGYVEGQEGLEGGEAPPAMGFAAGLMMKAHSLKEGVKEKGAGINLGNVQVGRLQIVFRCMDKSNGEMCRNASVESVHVAFIRVSLCRNVLCGKNKSRYFFSFQDRKSGNFEESLNICIFVPLVLCCVRYCEYCQRGNIWGRETLI